MFVVELNQSHFEYDVHAIVSAFYPGEQVKVLIPECSDRNRQLLQQDIRMRIQIEEKEALLVLDGERLLWHCPESQEYKAAFKRFLYSVLSKRTGHELPWGNLTGIRPTKIAYQLLEQGKSDQEIIDYYGRNYCVSREKSELSIAIARRERALLSSLEGQEGVKQGGNKQGGAKQEGIHEASRGYSLYVGIPFCPTTCMYCSFPSFPVSAFRGLVDCYIECLIRELEETSRQMQGKRLDCVYVGGGTPTTLEAGQLDRLLAKIKELFDFSAVKEFTVEAGRADSITEEKLKVLYGQGVGRISVNPQTMRQETLDLIGRKATVKQVEEAYELARRIGFDNINMDLILGLPGEGEEDVRHTVERVVQLAPDSLTVHSLAIKRASRLNQWIQEKGVSMLCNTDATMEIAAEGAARMGLVPYYLYRQKNMSGNFENVGYAKEEKLGLYNILIMEEVQTIVALGAGSITKRVYPDGRIERCENVKEVAQYIERIEEMIERKRVLFKD